MPLVKYLVDLFWAPLSPIFQQGIGGVARWLLQDGPKVLRALMLVFICIALGFSIVLWQRVSGAGQMLFLALSERQENTAQPFKGLEALVLSGLSVDVDTTIGGTEVHQGLQDKFDAIAKLSQSSGEGSLAPSNLTLDHVRVNDRAGFLTDRSKGFLFVPAVAVPLDAAASVKVNLRLDQQPEMFRDVLYSQRIAAQLCELLDTTLFDAADKKLDSKPVQSYFIARTGVTRLCEGGVATDSGSQYDYYKNQFSPNTLFQERPYFDAAVARGHGANQTIGMYFHSTRPYIDLGGNGFVKTFCRAVRLAPDAVVCVDLRLGEYAEDLIQTRLSRLGPSPIRVSCTADKCEADEPPTIWQQLTAVVTKEDFRLLNDRVRAHGRDGQPALSEIFGKISVHSGERSSGTSVVGEELIFTIPVSSRSASNRIATLLYCKINPGQFQRNTALIAGASGGSFFVALMLVIAIMADYGLRMKEQERAFASVARVMAKAPLAYCHVDETNRFRDYNDAFVIGILGCPTRDHGDAYLQNRTFRDRLRVERVKTCMRIFSKSG